MIIVLCAEVNRMVLQVVFLSRSTVPHVLDPCQQQPDGCCGVYIRRFSFAELKNDEAHSIVEAGGPDAGGTNKNDCSGKGERKIEASVAGSTDSAEAPQSGNHCSWYISSLNEKPAVHLNYTSLPLVNKFYRARYIEGPVQAVNFRICGALNE